MNTAYDIGALDGLLGTPFKRSLPWVSHPSNFGDPITPEHAEEDFIRFTSPHAHQEEQKIHRLPGYLHRSPWTNAGEINLREVILDQGQYSRRERGET